MYARGSKMWLFRKALRDTVREISAEMAARGQS